MVKTVIDCLRRLLQDPEAIVFWVVMALGAIAISLDPRLTTATAPVPPAPHGLAHEEVGPAAGATHHWEIYQRIRTDEVWI